MQGLISAEIVSAIALSIGGLALIKKKSLKSSTRALIICAIAEIVWSLCDATSNAINGKDVPDALIYITNYLKLVIGGGTFVMFALYCRRLIEERAKFNNALFWVPVGAFGLSAVYLTIEVARGNMFIVENGTYVTTNGLPLVCTIVTMVYLLYLVLIALLRFRVLGFRNSAILGFYGLIMFTAISVNAFFGVQYYTPAVGCIVLLGVILVLENRLTLEREQTYQKQLASKNIELTEQLNIITSVSKAFNVIYYIDMRDYSFIEVGVNREGVREVIGKQGDARESFEKMFQYLLDLEHVEPMRKFADLTTLNDRLRKRDWISHQFYGPIGGWSEGVFIAADRNANGICEHILWATRDIDEEKKREIAYQEALEQATDAANAANDAKTAFLFNMSHDIRTPMNAIMGFRDLLELHQDDPVKRAYYLNKIKDASAVLLSIINNVLEMARIEKGAIEIEETAGSIDWFMENMQAVFSEMMMQKGIKFTKEARVQHQHLYCDSTKVREVFINILSNAYKYTNPGGSVHFLLEELPHSKPDWVLIRCTVRDSGVGMSEDFLPHIFEEFIRENNTTDAKVEGTGLGMPIVKRLVELMGGTIEVYSKKDKGTTFVVTIPHRIAEDVTPVERVNVEPDVRNFDKKRVLLAEDNELNAEIAEVILNEAGFFVERAEDGAICLEKIQNSPAGYYDLVLMDIQMPNMNGYEATTAIRALEDPEKANIKILAMTANAFEEDKREALRVGMNGHLAKPIDIEELMRSIANVLA